jgi:hypothetical protein
LKNLLKKIQVIILLLLINCNYFENAKAEDNLFLKFLGLGKTASNTLQITLTQPKNLSKNNFLNTNIFITFNKNITGFNSSNFNLMLEDKTNLEGRIEMNENVLSFYPSKNLTPNTTFLISLKAENGLSKNTEFYFTTGTTVDNIPPLLVSTNPSNGESGIPINITVNATLSEEIDPNTLKSSIYRIIDVNGSLSILDRTIIISPSQNLVSNSSIIVILNSGLKDLSGNAMTSPSAWIFTTGATTAVDCFYDRNNYNSCILK